MNTDTITLKLKFKFPMMIVTPIGLILGNSLVGLFIELTHINWLIDSGFSVQWSDIILIMMMISLIILGTGYILLAVIAIIQMDNKAERKESKKKWKKSKILERTEKELLDISKNKLLRAFDEFVWLATELKGEMDEDTI